MVCGGFSVYFAFYACVVVLKLFCVCFMFSMCWLSQTLCVLYVICVCCGIMHNE